MSAPAIHGTHSGRNWHNKRKEPFCDECRDLTPLTLRGFRERIERQPELFDEFDWGGCGCFVDEGAAS